MYKLYTIAKKKTGILGLWKDNNKIYRDNIIIKDIPLINKQWENQALFDNGEKCIFYVYGKKAFIESKEGKIDILRHRITWNEKRLKASFVKLLLELHGGITIFKNENDYTLSIWKA
jgi:hypothetical protein